MCMNEIQIIMKINGKYDNNNRICSNCSLKYLTCLYNQHQIV